MYRSAATANTAPFARTVCPARPMLRTGPPPRRASTAPGCCTKLSPLSHWSLLAVLWVIVGLLVLRGILRRRYNGPRQLFNLLLIVSAMLVFTDWFHGYTGFSLDLAVPILCSISLVCNFIFSIVRSRYTVNALVYMLMNIGIGILPYLLLFFRVGGGTMNARNIPWVICLIISMITFLGLVIFRGRDLRCELEKRLHL